MANMYHLFGYIAGLSPVSMAQLLVRSKHRLRMAQARGAAKEAAPEKELVRLRWRRRLIEIALATKGNKIVRMKK
jgi:hypothetical protein